MERTLLQKISNISFYFLLIVSCYLASCSTFARWDDYATLLNFTRYALIFFSGFFHHISYKYKTLWILSTIILVLHGITAVIFSVVNEAMLIVEIIAFVILLTVHFLSRGKFDGEIKIHEFDVKREDGKYVKVSFKEKIPDKSVGIDLKTIAKEFLKTVLIVFVILVILFFAFVIFFIFDDGDFKEEVKDLPTEMVSQEYLAEFNSSDYVRLEWDSLNIEKDNCYYNNDAEYIVVSEPTRMISKSGKATESTYWQMGDNKNFIMKLVDEDFGNWTRAYYMHKDCALPNENDKIIKVTTRQDKEFKFSESQVNYIENLVKNFDDDLTVKPETEFLNENGFLDDYDLVFCFEDFDDIRLTCCSVVEDKNGQWYLYQESYYGYNNGEEIKLYDLEELPQDICDAINESFN